MYNYEYRFTKKFMEGKWRYFVQAQPDDKDSLLSSDVAIEVSKEVFDDLRRDDEREKKAILKRNDYELSLEYEYSEDETFLDFLSDTKNPLLENRICEEDFLRQLKEILSDAEYELLYALVVEGWTERAYAEKIHIPRSTLHSRKERIIKKINFLKKIL